MERPGTTQRAVLDPFDCPSPANLSRKGSHPTLCRGLSSPTRRRGQRCSPTRRSVAPGMRSPLGSTGNLLAQKPTPATYEGKSSSNLKELKKRLTTARRDPSAVVKWQSEKKGWQDVDAEVGEQLEYAWMKGMPKCGVWDNGLFREFDLNSMKEVPGLCGLRRVRIPGAPDPVAPVRRRPSSSL